MIVHFTDTNFKTETVAGCVIVDMYADWCGPCKMMEPIFEEVAGQFEGKVKMGKINVDEDPETPGQFGVTGIPTLLFFKEGELVGRVTGFQPKDALVGKIEELFGVK